MIDRLTLTAAMAAGVVEPGHEAQWSARVKQIALDLVVIDHELRGRIELLEKIQRGQDRSGVVRAATLKAVEVNSHGRGVLRFLAYSPAEGKVVEESVLTDFVNTQDGQALVERARGLVGHKVDIYKYQETLANNKARTARMCAHLVDRGAPEQDAPVERTPRPQVAPELMDETSAKQQVLQAAGQDTDLAKRAWEYISNPSGQVAADLVARAVEFATKHKES